jgi:hypothetical protein
LDVLPKNVAEFVVAVGGVQEEEVINVISLPYVGPQVFCATILKWYVVPGDKLDIPFEYETLDVPLPMLSEGVVLPYDAVVPYWNHTVVD